MSTRSTWAWLSVAIGSNGVRSLGVAVGTAGPLMLAGCNIVGPAYILAHGPPKLERETTLDKNRSIAVMIDDPSNVIPRATLRAELGKNMEEILLNKGLVKEAISSASVLSVAKEDRYGKRRSIVEVGRTVGADVVIWVGVEEFVLSGDGQSFSPTIQARVKLIDTESDARIWPTEEMGYPLRAVMQASTRALPTTRTDHDKAESDLARFGARALAELFYDEERMRAARAGNP